ncbi:hypothetical protein Tco_0215215 [Tanacetum coccineum]
MKSSKNIKAKLKDDLKAVDDIIDNGGGNDEVVKLRMDVLKSIQDIDKIQSLDAAQKAKIKWSIEGDENSSFYHGVELELEVSKDEVKRAVWDCGTDKAPGPDGFTFGFYRRFWKVIENDVFDAVNHFFTYGDIPKGCNSSFIAEFLKSPDANVHLNRGLCSNGVGVLYSKSHLNGRGYKAIHGEDEKVGKQVKSYFLRNWMYILHEINVLKNQGGIEQEQYKLYCFSPRRTPVPVRDRRKWVLGELG